MNTWLAFYLLGAFGAVCFFVGLKVGEEGRAPSLKEWAMILVLVLVWPLSTAALLSCFTEGV